MIQSTSQMHLAIIMDGNGRWAERRALPRAAGHRAGARAVRTAIETAARERIAQLTLYAFSSDNWRRPESEARTLMALFTRYFRAECDELTRAGARLTVIGRRDRLPLALRDAITDTERATRDGTAVHVRLAIDYSARDAIARGEIIPDVDLLIRTGGERRLSDFLLWESAYAELVFTPVMWPDFGAADLVRALTEFRSRERRFGALSARAS